MSKDEKMELEAPNPVIIPLGAEAIVPVQWQAHLDLAGDLWPGVTTGGTGNPGFTHGLHSCEHHRPRSGSKSI